MVSPQGRDCLLLSWGNGEKVTNEAVSELDIDGQGEMFEKKLGGDVSGESTGPVPRQEERWKTSCSLACGW